MDIPKQNIFMILVLDSVPVKPASVPMVTMFWNWPSTGHTTLLRRRNNVVCPVRGPDVVATATVFNARARGSFPALSI